MVAGAAGNRGPMILREGSKSTAAVVSSRPQTPPVVDIPDMSGKHSTTRLSPMIMRETPGVDAPPVKAAPYRPPIVGSLPANYDYYQVECSPQFYKDNFQLSNGASELVKRVETYWSRRDLSRLDRWILRNLLPCAVSISPADKTAEVATDSGKSDILTRCAKEYPDWVIGVKHRLQFILQ